MSNPSPPPCPPQHTIESLNSEAKLEPDQSRQSNLCERRDFGRLGRLEQGVWLLSLATGYELLLVKTIIALDLPDEVVEPDGTAHQFHRKASDRRQHRQLMRECPLLEIFHEFQNLYGFYEILKLF